MGRAYEGSRRSPRAVVLGAGGFIGSHLCRGLVRAGWDVTGVVRHEAAHILGRLRGVVDDVRLVSGDVGDCSLLERVLPQADAVYPLAGRSGATRSMQSPGADLAGNLTAHLNLLEVLRVVNPDARVVFPGSRLQYGVPNSLPVGEYHQQAPTSFYGVHKVAAESYYRIYHEQHGLATCCLRISNPYGPWQGRPDASFGIIGTFMRSAAVGGTIEVYGNGSQVRDFLYIDDLVELFLKATTTERAVGEVFNAGGPAPVSVRLAAEVVARVVGQGLVAEVPWPRGEFAVETGDYLSDLRNVRRVLGWQPRTDLAEGIELTWAAESNSVGVMVDGDREANRSTFDFEVPFQITQDDDNAVRFDRGAAPGTHFGIEDGADVRLAPRS